ncbi:MAG: hypothetical protein Q4D38_14825, partial [Planctomycetia bacterium]|nr:hypothetical protein [Planctomycetia bacterium]
VLDEYCVSCHSGPDPDGGCDLSGGKTRFFSVSYDNLLGRSRSYRQHDMHSGRLLDSERARGVPLVHFYWLLWTPTGVNQPLEAGIKASRLPEYLTYAHCGREIPKDALERIYLWVDADVPYYATYANSRPQTPGKRDAFAGSWFSRDFMEVYARRCAECHGAFDSHEEGVGRPMPNTSWTGRFAWINLSEPENSPAMVAHAPKPRGRGIPLDDEGKKFVFDSPQDADYQKMLSAIREGKRALESEPRADMKGFRFKKREF